MILDQQQHQEALQELKEDSTQKTADGQQKLDVHKPRVEHSTDVNRSQMQPIIKPSVNFMSTINPEIMLQNHNHQQAQAQLVDPFSKINNPKARKLIQNVDRQQRQASNTQDQRRHDSTGGSDHINLDSSYTTQVPNARNAYHGGNNMIKTNSKNISPQDMINMSFSQSPNILFANQTQAGFYQSKNNNTSVNSGRQQIPSPSYQNYLFSEKLTPSHYRSPIQINQLFTPGNPVIIDDQRQQQFIKTSTIKPGRPIPNNQKQNEIISNLQEYQEVDGFRISQVSSSLAKYRSASRSHEQQQQQPSQKMNKKQIIPQILNYNYRASMNSGLQTPAIYGKNKNGSTFTAGNTNAKIQKIKALNTSFQEAQQTFTNFNDSIDIDLMMNPSFLGKTQINFAKNIITNHNSRMGISQKKSSPQPQSGRQNSPQHPKNLSFQIGNPNQTIIIRNPPQATHVKHNSEHYQKITQNDILKSKAEFRIRKAQVNFDKKIYNIINS
ncbi:UNKNOWN [Stylonychia lemnae]|uniref:Uncharacterized protein n=1 Tax=Stylonychia lemnae TaxID=5949 RepID=A0A078A4E2_STYLE|nr:UNKNOWN [Stylonychia lemnae]|eukprot:CDW77123.1 UNKNOWN [Stylonychia lemnae]